MMEVSAQDVSTTYSNDILVSTESSESDRIDQTLGDSTSAAHEENGKRKFDETIIRTGDVATNSKGHEVGADKKRSKVDDNAASEQSESTAIRIKLEPVDCVESASTTRTNEPCALPTKESGSYRIETTTSAEDSNPSQIEHSLAKIKTEKEDESPTVSNDNGNGNINAEAVSVKAEIKVEVADANSGSNVRPSCRFGIRCYRANPMHRTNEAHPGDQDYRRPNYPNPPLGTPACRFGNACYRRNPIHFTQFAHPPDTDFAQNYFNYQQALRPRLQRQPVIHIPNDSDDEYAFDDDSGSDFEPDEGVESDLEEAEHF